MFGRRATSEKLAALTTGVGHHVPNPPKSLAMVPPGYRAMHKLPLQGYFHLRRLRRTSHPRPARSTSALSLLRVFATGLTSYRYCHARYLL